MSVGWSCIGEGGRRSKTNLAISAPPLIPQTTFRLSSLLALEIKSLWIIQKNWWIHIFSANPFLSLHDFITKMSSWKEIDNHFERLQLIKFMIMIIGDHQGICQIFYTSKIRKFLNFAREKHTNRIIFGQKLRTHLFWREL